MSERDLPQTEAGRRLHEELALVEEDLFLADILAIEQEAREHHFGIIGEPCDYARGYEDGAIEARDEVREPATGSERDRLADLLAEFVLGERLTVHSTQTAFLDAADRLIAAGVGFRPEPVRDVAARLGIPVTPHPLPDNRAFADDRPADLDVERLERALHAVYHDGRPGEPSPHDSVIYCAEDAAAIAKAYRDA